ncbi:hypothetical protein ACWD4P_18345 [Kitasatospora sp. NPDC002543]
MSVGVHLDPEFRRRVIGELVKHEERSVPPSLGFDLVTVLAHALRARRAELLLGAVLAALWIGFACVALLPAFGPSDGGTFEWLVSKPKDPDKATFELVWPYVTNFAGFYAVVTLVTWFAKPASLRRHVLHAAPSTDYDRPPARPLRVFAAGLQVVLQLVYWILALWYAEHEPAGVLFPLALAAAVGGHRLLTARLMRKELSRDAFHARPTSTLPDTPRHQRLRRSLDTEQHSRLIIYDPATPFLGAGFPHEAWSFVLELKHRTTGPVVPSARDLTARDVLELIVPRLAGLRQAAALTSLDRLREMEIDDVVFLPHGPIRSEVPRSPEDIAQHLAEAVDEGGEPRRRFLRVRIGSWGEQVVLTVHLRVHTQGQLLVVEVVPHVLGPVWREYELLADAVVQRGTHWRRHRPATSAFTASPAAMRHLLRPGDWALRPSKEAPGVVSARPLVSLRELATDTSISLFQELDVSRYLKTVKERIIDGVREALHSQGYETGRFEQNVVQVMSGGIHIGSMSGGAVATSGGTAGFGGPATVHLTPEGVPGPAS